MWHDQRRFMLRHLRDFGFGRRFEDLEIETNEELLHFVDLLKNGPKYDFEKVTNEKLLAFLVLSEHFIYRNITMAKKC